MRKGAADAYYAERVAKLRAEWDWISTIAKFRYGVERAEEAGEIESADDAMKEILDLCEAKSTDKSKMISHAELHAQGMKNPEAFEDFIATIFGGFRIRGEDCPSAGR